MSVPEALAEALERRYGEAALRNVVPVGGRPSNRSWLVTVDGSRIIAKLPERRGGLTVGPAIEAEILARAAELGIGPQPLGIDADTGVLFVEALAHCSELDSRDVADDGVMTRVAETVRRLHTIAAPAELREFDAVLFAEEYGALVDTEPGWRLRDEIQRLADRCGHQLIGDRLCHNDLHAANILVGERVRLIDFEYSVQAAPLVDVASYAAFNGLDEHAASAFAVLCLGDDLPFSAAQLGEAARIQRLLGELWEMARSDNNARSRGPVDAVDRRRREE